MIYDEKDRVTSIICHPVFVERLNIIEKKEKDRIFCKHGLEHLTDVARIAMIINLSDDLGFERDVVCAAAYLHDIGRSEEGNHEENGVKISESILAECGYNRQEVNIIADAILKHRQENKGFENDKGDITSLIAKADKLSRNCFSCSARNECYWDEKMKNKRIF